MNTKQIAALCVGIVALFAAMVFSSLRSNAHPVSTQRLGSHIEMTEMQVTISPAEYLIEGAVVALTLGAIYVLRPRSAGR